MNEEYNYWWDITGSAAYRICRSCGVGELMPLDDHTSLCKAGCRIRFVPWVRKTHPKLWRIACQRKRQEKRVTALVTEWLLTVAR